MGAFTHLLRDINQILFRDAEQHAIPSMDGALSPNSALDHCTPVGDPLPGADCVVAAPDGSIFVSAGPRVLRLSGAGFETRGIAAEFDKDAGGLALHPDGRLLVCVAERGLAAVDSAGRQSWLNQAEDKPLHCLTSVAATADGTIFMTEGSTRTAPADWVRDLMEKNSAGRILSCGPQLDEPRTVLRDLPYPNGLAVSRDGRQLFFTEAWSHRLCRALIEAQTLGPVTPVLPNLAGYPGRLGHANAGGFWLAIPAVRTHLIEFVLREDDYREEMIHTIPPQYWIAPALATRGDALEPMQSGGIKALGIEKPWAPPRSYGLVARVEEDGEFVESLHSRVGGKYHGITSACDTAQGLVIISKGHGRVLLDTSGAKA
jgi:hypothetical protein